MKRDSLLLTVIFCISNFSNVHASHIETTEENLNSALSLKEPFIRISIPDYLQTSHSPKLLLGEGHISNTETLPIEFRKDGAQELTESMIRFDDHSYDFHKNEGYYTVSAELSPHFNSDWCGNLRNSAHRKTLFLPDTFDLIFDATYPPDAISKPLFSDIASSLRSKGVFIMTLPITEEDGLFMCGHKGFSHEMPWYSRELKFNSLHEVYEHWEDFLHYQGFSRVTFHKSPFTLFLEKLYEEGALSKDGFENLNKEDIEIIKGRFKNEVPLLSRQSPVFELDPHLAHYGLGTHYFIAKK